LQGEWELAESQLEARLRTWAIPVALGGSFLLVATGPGRFLVRVFLSMWVHEIGHATTAWLCGFPAFPGPWLTPMAQSRSPLFGLVVFLALAVAAYRAFRAERIRLGAAILVHCLLVERMELRNGRCRMHGLSKSAVSRVVGTLKSELATWEKRSLADLDVAFLYLDAIALRVRMDKRVTSVPVLVALAVLADGQKQLVALEMCGSESHEAWKGFLDGLVERGLRAPVLCIVDGNPGLRRALSTVWSKTPVQRCAVHKLRNLERKAPNHALAEVKADFHEIVYAESEAAARKVHAAFVSKWKSRCPGVVKSLEEAGDELFTMYRFPKQQWKDIRTTNVIERLNGEFRRRVKTQGSLPSEDAALVLLFGLIATGQIKLRKIDGYKKLAGVISEQMRRAA
jgi:mutator family transposase